ncbi:DUF2637 domain-containing protein [Nocardia sp. NBC_01388]|uniref:DUF2637 domain-containing protein n=1 Tax=Nocardia sp. NBC_01388 TaxID=2903596 RepID=UPI0032505F76
MLTVSAAVSIGGNAAHAVLHAQSLPVVAAAVAIVPPFALLAAVHGVTVLLRAHARSRAIHLLATLMTALIAAGAFSLSFTALRDLAIVAGIPEPEAWIWPMIIEGSMTQATLALLALAHTPASRAHAVHSPHSAHGDSVKSDACDHLSSETAASAPSDVRTPDEPDITGTDPWTRVAAKVCANDPAHRRDPVLVARILAAHHNDGRNPSQIAHELNRSRSSVSRILTQARKHIPSDHASLPLTAERTAT